MKTGPFYVRTAIEKTLRLTVRKDTYTGRDAVELSLAGYPALMDRDEDGNRERVADRLFGYRVQVRDEGKWLDVVDLFRSDKLMKRIEAMAAVTAKQKDAESLRAKEATFAVDMLMSFHDIVEEIDGDDDREVEKAMETYVKK